MASPISHRMPAILLCSFCFQVACAQWSGPTGAQNRIDYVTGNVYVGSAGFTNPAVRFDVVDRADSGRTISFHAFAGTPQSGIRTTAIWGETNNPNGRALQGFNFASSGQGAGVWAETASFTGTGIRARATAITGSSTAAYVDNASNNGIALFSQCTSGDFGASPIAIWGDSVLSTGYAGYFTGGRTYFQNNVGIGTFSPAHPLHIVGSNDIGALVSGNLSITGGSSTGGAAGVRGVMAFTTPGPFSAGVWGINNGLSTAGIGVAGYHAGSGYGVYGNVADQATGWAGFFQGRCFVNGNSHVQGDLSVTGSVSKSGGTFKIDHPLDPANKYLYHSFVESPDMMNIYNGTVSTDSSGYATVTMPDYFEALNRDFRYQLTIIDDSDSGWALAKVTSEIKDREFTIRTSLPNQKVSWQVTGIRHDPWANSNRVKVEVEKEPENQGRYLHPATIGLPDSLAITPAHSQPATLPLPKTSTQVAPDAPARAKPAGAHEPPLVPAIGNGR